MVRAVGQATARCLGRAVGRAPTAGAGGANWCCLTAPKKTFCEYVVATSSPTQKHSPSFRPLSFRSGGWPSSRLTTTLAPIPGGESTLSPALCSQSSRVRVVSAGESRPRRSHLTIPEGLSCIRSPASPPAKHSPPQHFRHTIMRLLALLLLAATAAAAPDGGPVCGTACASTLVPGGALTLPPSSVIARFEAMPDAAACCGKCQAMSECVAFLWCGDGGACAVPSGAPPLFGGAAQKGTCLISSEPATRAVAGASAAAVTAGRSAWTAGQKACVTGPKTTGPSTTAAPQPKPAAAQPPKTAATQPPPVDDDDDEPTSTLGPGSGRYAGASVAAANNLRPGTAPTTTNARSGLVSPGDAAPRLPGGLARLTPRAGAGPQPLPPPQGPPQGLAARQHGPRRGGQHGPTDDGP